MKKLFGFLTIAAMATFILVSCESKKDSTENSSASQEQISSESASASAQSEEVKIEDQKELTCKTYTITVPEGWKASSRMVNNSCNLTLKENPHTTAALNTSSSSVEDYTKYITDRGGKAIEDITVNGKTYKVFITEKNDRAQYDAFAVIEDGLMTYRILPGGTPMKGQELKDVLVKNLNDIIAATTFE